MIQRQWVGAAMVTLFLGLASCGGGSDPQPAAEDTTTNPATNPTTNTGSGSTVTANPAITLAAYSTDRSTAVPAQVPPADALSAALALALPQLQSTVNTLSGSSLRADSAIVLPALQAARIDVLHAAAAGSTLAEVEAALPAEASASATRALLDGVSRRLWADTSSLFERKFLASTDTGGSAATPWQAFPVDAWAAVETTLAEFGSVSDLKLSPQTRLAIGQRFDAAAPANGQAVAFEGVGVRSPDVWYTAPMVALDGPGGTLQGSDYTATATWVGNHLWVSMRPLGDAPLSEGLPIASLRAALIAVWSAYPAPDGLSTRSRQVWPQQSTTLEDRSRLPAGIQLPYSEVNANLSGLDGGGTHLREVAPAASLAIDATGLRVSGAQAMAFTSNPANAYSNGGAAINTRVPPAWDFSPDCPRATADWRGAYLVLIDRAGRPLLLATLPDTAGTSTICNRL